MIEDTIGKNRSEIKAGESINPERKQELLQLLGTLRSEMATLSQTHRRGGAKHRCLRGRFRPTRRTRAQQTRNCSSFPLRD